MTSTARILIVSIALSMTGTTGVGTVDAAPSENEPALEVTATDQTEATHDGAEVPGQEAGPESAPSHPPTSLDPHVVVRGSGDQQQRVGDALSTFKALGMALPDLEARFWQDREPCDGHLGLFHESTQPWSIDICSDLPFVVPHELGHAWERATLSDDDRSAYMDLRGFAIWQDPQADRADQAIEDVAFVIQLTVLAGGSTGRDDVDAAFRTLVDLTTDSTSRRAKSAPRLPTVANHFPHNASVGTDIS